MDVERPHGHRFRFSIRSMIVVVTCLAVYLSLFVWEQKRAAVRKEAFERLEDQFYTTGEVPYAWWLGTGWLHSLVGDEKPPTLGFAVFNNFSYVNDDTLKDLAVFEELYDLHLGGGEIEITESGLNYLIKLRNLEELDLVDAPVSDESVAALRRAMPRCTIHWNGDEL